MVGRAAGAPRRGRAHPAGAATLAELGIRIEELYGAPQDIGWAMHDGQPFILQVRPITGRRGGELVLEEWNDSLAGDHLWTNGNIGEAFPSVMTPATWSFAQIFIAEAMAPSTVVPLAANIGGRFYLNLGLNIRFADKLGLRPVIEQVYGRLPEDVEVPPLPAGFWRTLPQGLALAARRGPTRYASLHRTAGSDFRAAS